MKLTRLNSSPEDGGADNFTLERFEEAVELACRRYRVATFDSIPWDEGFILWRHDIDFSLNRALDLAEIEARNGMTATYFVDLHSPYYNPFEASQTDIIRRILDFGHRFGLHFDASYHRLNSEVELGQRVKMEREFMENLLGVKVDAVSFHNPSDLHLTWQEEEYGGLVNCYSRRFRESVGYCSDSNGYWRFRPLIEALTSGDDLRLQVLTHPGHWQPMLMPPRERVLRCVYGRASAVMQTYDRSLDESHRENRTGMPKSLVELRSSDGEIAGQIDMLWFARRTDLLLIDLWNRRRLLGEQQNEFQDQPVLQSKSRDLLSFLQSCMDVEGVGGGASSRSVIAEIEQVASEILLLRASR